MAAAQVDSVRLSSDDGKIITVRTSLLVDNSEYFRRLISDRSGREAIVLDNNATEIYHMIEFLEHSTLQLTSVQNGIDMYKIGHKYEINGLKELCRNRLIEMIDNTNVCKIHDFACEIKDQIIRYHCWNRFTEHAKDILKTDDFLSCKDHTIWWLAYRPYYRNLTEVDLFNGLYAWAEKKEAALPKRTKSAEPKTKVPKVQTAAYKHLGFVFQFIRFLSMELEELEREVFPKKFLTEEIIKLVRSYFQNQNIETLKKMICTTTTKRTVDISHTLYRYKLRNDSKHPAQQIEAGIQFRSDFAASEFCFLHSFKFPISHNYERVEITMTIRVWTTTTAQVRENVRIPIDQGGIVNVDPPMFLEKSTDAMITAEFDNDEITSHPNINLKENCDIYFDFTGKNIYYIDANLLF